MSMHSNISFVLDWLLITSCKGVVAALLILVLRKALARWITPQGRYLLWLPVILCFLVPTGWQVTFPSLDVWSKHQASVLLESQTISVQLSDAQSANTAPSRSESHADVRVNSVSPELIKLGLIVLWLSGVLILMLIVARNIVRYAQIRTEAMPANEFALDLFNECRAAIGVTKAVELKKSSAISSPIITGWLKPVLLLPEDAEQRLSRNEMRHVFLHELSHVKRIDLPMSWPMTVVQILNWFNPLVWYAGREFRADMESACDADVLSALKENDRNAYGHTLIKLSEPPVIGTLLECGAGIMERYSQLKARINMINQFNPPTLRRNAVAAFALSMILPLTCLQPLALAASSTVQPSSVTPVTPAASQTLKPINEVPAITSTTRIRSVEAKAEISRDAKPVVDQGSTDELESLYLKVQHTNAADLAVFVRPETGLSLLSSHGSIAVDTRTNSLLVHDKKENLESVKELVARLDVPLKKVMIEARMLIVDNSVVDELIARAKSGRTATDHQPVSIDVRGIVNRLGKNYDVNAEITSIQAAHKGEVVSSPKVLTEVRREAVIQQGIVVPEGASNNSENAPASTRLLIGLKLKPDITPENRINFDVSFSRESALPPLPSQGPEKEKIEKRVDDKIQIVVTEMLHNGETMLLADNYGNGKLKASGKRLLVFLTPRIMNEDGSYDL